MWVSVCVKKGKGWRNWGKRGKLGEGGGMRICGVKRERCLGLNMDRRKEKENWEEMGENTAL
ncbi:hypothetical protein, partial [Bacillus subtilis]|uniref:hypothetical protein n=1 Tax=Bacillus subtilis TaxID=1423 RepID=UPI001BDBB045